MILAFTYLKVKSAKCLLFTSDGLVILVLVVRIWSCLHHCQTPVAGGACFPSPRTHPALGLDFRPIRASIQKPLPRSSSLHFPQCIGVLIKTLVVPIFAAKECTRMQDFVLKIYKNPGGRDPRTPAAEGDICSHPPPCLPARCWCPYAYSRLAMALVWRLRNLNTVLAGTNMTFPVKFSLCEYVTDIYQLAADTVFHKKTTPYLIAHNFGKC